MWVYKFLFFYILLIFFKSFQGKNSVKASTVITTDLAQDFLDPLTNQRNVSEILQRTEIISDNSISLPETTTEVVLKKLPHRIVNGTKAILGQFPQQVSLRRRYSQSHFCGGSILTVEWILTAAHCMLDNKNKILRPYAIFVVAGEIALKNMNSARQWSYVRKIIVHPKFDVEALRNDVALLQLNSPLTFDAYVKPAPVARKRTWPRTICQVSGWGYQKFGDNIVSGNLMYIDIPLMSVGLCRNLMVNYTNVPAGMICAGYLEGGRDACQGDSGGGMLCKGFLTGVVSGGEGCAWPRLPGLYADVKFYVPWIKQYVDLRQNFVNTNPVSRVSSSSKLSSPLFGLLLSLLCTLHSLITPLHIPGSLQFFNFQL